MHRKYPKYVTLALAALFCSSLAVWLKANTTLAVPLNQTAVDPLMQGLNIPANASTVGMWSTTQPWPMNAIHVTVMPDGRVLTYGTPPNSPDTQDGRIHDYWNPLLGFGANSHQTTTDFSRPNSFCGTSSFLLDGRLMLSGGNSAFNSALINPQTGAFTADPFTLADQRWYATMVTLADGRIAMVGGMDPYTEGQQDNPVAAIQANQASMTPEIYTQGTGWRTLTGATSRDAFGPDFLRNSYPRAWPTADGRVFGISADNMWYLDVNANGGAGLLTVAGRFKTPNINAPVNAGATGTAVMYAPGRILMVGGNGSFNGDNFPASNMATIVDITGQGPVVTETNRMTFPRRFPNAVVLPNGRVVITGGTRRGNNGGADAVYAAEIWDPATGNWTVGASAAQIRVYHSSTTLLPNGTILSVGGGTPGPVYNQNAEIYYPPYLFTPSGTLAPRPVMTGINALNFSAGGTVQIQMSDASPISSLALVRSGSMTHSFNNGQRYQALTFTQAGDMLTATLPGNANNLPPGYYQIFALNANGVPSQAVIVSIGLRTVAPPPPLPALGAEWVSAGTTASRLAVSTDNTIAVIDPATGTVRRKTGDDTNASWTTVAGQTLRAVALVNGGSIWGAGTDQNVWRYNGTSWAQVGNTVSDIAASSDGTIVAVNAVANTIWRKRGDDNIENWTNVPGTAKRVALVNSASIWAIGMDDGIYRHDGANWVRVGTGFARAIAANANGTIAYLDRDTSQLYRKTGDNATANWELVAGRMPEVAVAASGALWAISGTNQVHRRAPEATLPAIPAITAPPVLAGTSANYNPGLTGAGLTFSWNFGDGSAATPFVASSAISYTFATPGQYAVRLTVRNAQGQTASRTFIQAVFSAPTAGSPNASSQMVVEPRSGASARLWVVNPDTQSVSVIDTATNARVSQIPVGVAPRTMARASDGSFWVVNRDSATISVVSPASLAVTRTINLPPASQPYGIVTGPNGLAYVSLEALGRVLKLDAAGNTLALLNVGPNPRHLSLSADGNRLLVSRFITPPVAGESTLTPQTANAGGEVLVVDTVGLTLARTIRLQHSDKTDTEIQGAGLPNYLGAAVISPDGSSAWVPSKQDNIRRGTARNGQNLNFQNTVRAISSRINLATLAELFPARIDHDNASLASAAVFHPTGAYLFVALETSRQVAVVDPLSNTELFRIPAGLAPQALALSPDGQRLYVHNFMGRTVTAVDLSPLTVNGEFRTNPLATIGTIATEQLPAATLRGKQLFYDAADPRLARDSYLSCATCHNDGASDGRVWDLTGFGEGLRRTIRLQGRAGMGHGFLHWSGNFDEVQDFEAQIRNLAGGTGLLPDGQFNSGTRNQPLGDAKAGLSADLDALAAYVASLSTFAPSPNRNPDGTLTAAALAGRAVFTAQNCQSCHGGSAFTLSAGATQLRSVGTIKATSGSRLGAPLSALDIPTLRDLWASSSFLHDGSAPTLEAAIQAHSGNTVAGADLTNLVAYMLQIGGAEPGPALPAGPPAVSLTAPVGGATFPVGTAITITASATAGTGRTLTGVTFLDGATVLGTVTAAPYTFNWTNATAGAHALTARATDNTGASTTSAVVNITVAAAPPSGGLPAGALGAWDFDAATATQAPDSSGQNNPLTLGAGTQLIPGSLSGNGFRMVGDASIAAAVSARPVLNTAGSFSVSGWIRFDQFPECWNQMLASQDGVTVSGFYLGITPSCGGSPARMTFSMQGADTDASATYRISGGTPVVGQWYHLTAVRDAVANTMALYVDGVLVGTLDNPTKWNANGSFAVGRAKFSAGLRDPAFAAIDAVLAYGRVLTPAEVAALYNARGGSGTVVPPPPVVPPPTVSLTAPVGGASFTVGAAITLTASATAGTGRTVTGVTFLDGSTVLGTVTTAPYTFNWTNAAVGPHALTARATDNTGATTTSATVNITVNAAANPAVFTSTVVNVRSGRCIAITSASTVDGANAIQQTCSTATSQQFRFTLVAGTSNIYTLTAAHSGKLLDVFGVSVAAGTRLVQWGATGGANQRFQVTRLADGTFTLRPVHSNLFVAVRSGSLLSGATVEQNLETTTGSTRWRLPGRP